MKKLIELIFDKKSEKETFVVAPKRESWEVSKERYNAIHGLGDTLI